MRGTGMLLLTTEVSEPINRVRQPLPTIRSTGWFEISKSPACPRVSTHQNRPIPASPQVTAATERPPVCIASVTSSETPARRPSYFCPHVSAHPVLNHLLRSDPGPWRNPKGGLFPGIGRPLQGEGRGLRLVPGALPPGYYGRGLRPQSGPCQSLHTNARCDGGSVR